MGGAYFRLLHRLAFKDVKLCGKNFDSLIQNGTLKSSTISSVLGYCDVTNKDFMGNNMKGTVSYLQSTL